MNIKRSTPKPTTAPAPEVKTPAAGENVVQTAASTAMDIGGPVALDAAAPSEDLLAEFAPGLRGAAKPAASGAAAVKSYDATTKEFNGKNLAAEAMPTEDLAAFGEKVTQPFWVRGTYCEVVQAASEDEARELVEADLPERTEVESIEPGEEEGSFVAMLGTYLRIDAENEASARDLAEQALPDGADISRVELIDTGE